MIDENCPRRPVTLYGVAKASQEMVAEYNATYRRFPLIIVRPFNLCGPGQGLGMMIPDWLNQLAAIERGAETVLRIRNKATSRDFIDVRDAARAIALLCANFKASTTVNVASGEAVAIAEILATLGDWCSTPFRVEETDPIPDATVAKEPRGSFERLTRGWNWRPEIPWRQSLADSWDEWIVD